MSVEHLDNGIKLIIGLPTKIGAIEIEVDLLRQVKLINWSGNHNIAMRARNYVMLYESNNMGNVPDSGTSWSIKREGNSALEDINIPCIKRSIITCIRSFKNVC